MNFTIFIGIIKTNKTILKIDINILLKKSTDLINVDII